MFNRCDRLFVTRSGPRATLALLVFSVLLYSVLDWIKAHLGEVPMPGASLSYSAEQAYQALTATGDEGRRWFTAYQLVDLLLIPTYALLFATTMRWTWRRLGANGRVVTLLMFVPLIGALSDLAENSCLLILLAAFPRPLSVLATVAGGFTTVKWVLDSIAALLAVGGLSGVALAWAGRILRREPWSATPRPSEAGSVPD